MTTNHDQQRSDSPWDRAAYPAAEAARLVGLSSGRVRRWLKGYEYVYENQLRSQSPVILRKGTAGTSYASFLDLVDLLFVKRFLDEGISLQKLRKALAEAAEILGTIHFANQSFFTDGRNIYLDVKDRGEAIVQLLANGQWVIAPIIQELARQIVFDDPTGLARQWFPRGPEGLVVLDPAVAFGRPTISGKGVATANVVDFYRAEGGNTEVVCSWMSLEPKEVQAAVEFEEALAA